MGSTKKCGYRVTRSDEILEGQRPIHSVEHRAPLKSCFGHKWSCRRFPSLRKKRRNNDQRCPVDNEPLIEAEVAGGQLSEVRLSSEELQHFIRPSSRGQTQQLSFPIQEQHPNLPPGPFCGQVSRPGEAGDAARLRPGEEGYRLPYQSEDGNQASRWSGFSTLGGQGSGQRTSPFGLFSGYQQVEGGRDRFQSRSNVPTVEQGQESNQRYRRNGSQNRVIPAKQKELVTEHCFDTREVQLWSENQQRSRSFDEAVILSQIKGLICRGTYYWKIRNFYQCRQDAITGAMVAQFSPAIYTDLYGYRFCVRIYLNGVNSGVGTHVALFVHMMQGECDDRLSWPFTGVITLSILDQSGADVPEDISQVLVASRKLCAFKRPDTPCSTIGCGFEMFAPIAQIFGGPFIQNDTMLVKIEISR